MSYSKTLFTRVWHWDCRGQLPSDLRVSLGKVKLTKHVRCLLWGVRHCYLDVQAKLNCVSLSAIIEHVKCVRARTLRAARYFLLHSSDPMESFFVFIWRPNCCPHPNMSNSSLLIHNVNMGWASVYDRSSLLFPLLSVTKFNMHKPLTNTEANKMDFYWL